ncbi:YheC/YheD family protein [Bacillus timonensis]|nr:YheC/YheD family protein [Bacillus timonensis]
MKATISLSSQQGNQIYLPKKYYNPKIRFISFGSFTKECHVNLHDKPEELSISEDLFKELHIPYLSSIHLFVHENTLYVGALVGIFTAGFTDSKFRPVGERSLFFAKLLSIEQTVGVISFVFGAHQINWDKGTINGYFYRKDGWAKIEVPFPNVVYDRLPNRKTANHRAFIKIKKRLSEEYLIPWFNPGFFNKWEIHKLLQKDTLVAAYLPETYEQPSIERIERMLSKYNHVFLKPANGSLGLGVFQIIYSREEEAYYCRYKDDQENENRLQKFTSLEALLKRLFRNKQLENYIVQQGITLMRKEHKVIDFRIHTNKNVRGKWEVSVIAGKISGRGSVTTHINNGGLVKTIEEIFPTRDDCIKAREKLKEAALLLSRSIDDKVEGSIGEIGFDLGIDKNGHLWLFEANSKPGRSIFAHPKLKDFDFTSRKLSLEYALFLTENTIKQPEEVLL